jgi:phosphatidylinositol-3-phosphatase
VRFRSIFALVALALALAACGSPESRPGRSPASPRSPSKLPASKSSRVVVVVMENKEYGQVIGKSSAPYINRLARRYALLTNFYGVSHPSLPNYLALTGGDTFGIDSDCTSCHVGAKSLVDELEPAGISWKAYMEGMPSACFKGPEAGRYAKKHDPFVYYDRIVKNRRRCSKVVRYSQLGRDLKHGRLPSFVWITPNLCNDMHDCSVKTGDRYLSRLVPSLLRELGPHGVLFLTWDEGESDRGCCRVASGGRIATIVAGPDVRPGTRSGVSYNHYSLLRAITDAFRVTPLGKAGCPCTKRLDVFSRRPAL